MKLSITKRKILSQLQENTGRALCDSGDAYGRHWQRNQNKTWDDFTSDPVTLEAYAYTPKDGSKPTTLELSGTVSVAAFLENNLVYSPELQRAFTRWCKAHPDEYDMDWMKGFAEKHDSKAIVVNSYNGECDLSQVIQFVEFEWGEYGDRYVLLQIHGGCDVRGGYSSPIAYELRDYVEGLYDWNVDSYWCAGEYWDTAGEPSDGGKNLFKDYTVGKFEWESTLAKDLENLKLTDHDTEATRQLMAAEDTRQCEEAFNAFMEEGDIVVRDHKAYLNGKLIEGSCNGLCG